MNKRFNTALNPILSSVIDTLEASLQCPKFNQMSSQINIHTLEDLEFSNSENRQTVEKGFGACSIRDYGLAGVSIAIVMNMKNCAIASLTEREIAAVVLHELGHILNEPELEPEPTFEFCFVRQRTFSRELLNRVQNTNEMRKEVFADAYANQYGYEQETLSTLNKQNELFKQQIGYYIERVQELQRSNYHKGKIMSLTPRSIF